ncbi:MAG: class I SAM-dependent methyltransferase [Chloroflexi bacterium]|nr:class I SAM-dependent methyltransferase [Chloroflexota bacterium]
MQSFDPSYFQILRQVEEQHFWFRARSETISACLNRWLPNPTRILEVGCGNGNVLRAMRQRLEADVLLVGLDIYQEGLKNAATLVSAEWIQGDALALPFGEVFDVVGLFDVLEHLPDDRSALMSVHEVMRPGGLVFLTVPAHQKLWSYFDVLSHHQRRYSKGELAQKLVGAGFELKFLSYYMAITLPLVFLGRWLAKSNNASTVLAGEMDLRIYPILNELLLWALRAERYLLLRRGLPFGTSLLAVARCD